MDFAVPAFTRSLAWSLRCRRLGRSGRGRGVPWGSVGMATSFHRSARCPHIGLKEGSRELLRTGGLLPFPRTGCVLVRDASVIRLIQQVKGPPQEWPTSTDGGISGAVAQV